MWSINVKKIPAFCFLLLCIVSVSFAQIFRGEGEIKDGRVSFSLHYVEYADYRYLLYIDGVSIFIEKDQLVRLEAVLEKFTEWEEMAKTEQISLTKTIDSIPFSSFYYNHTFFKEPVIFYFVFTGGPPGTPGSGTRTEGTTANSETPPARYLLFIDTTLERITPFRLASKTVEEMLAAITTEKLREALDAYEQQKALEEMFQ